MFARFIRILTLSTIFVQICIVSSSFAEMPFVYGYMLPDSMGVVEEENVVVKKQDVIVTITQVQPKLVPDVNLSIDPICRGKYPNSQWYKRCGMIGKNPTLQDVIADVKCEGFYF
jgi:hypothetical protein